MKKTDETLVTINARIDYLIYHLYCQAEHYEENSSKSYLHTNSMMNWEDILNLLEEINFLFSLRKQLEYSLGLSYWG